MRRIGYLRISTDEQLPDRQILGLKPVCDEMYVETLSASSKSRPMYRRALRRLRAGDILVVWDLDRAYRSAREALNEVHLLRSRGIGFLVYNWPIDTTTPEGKFLLTVLLGAGEFERDLLSRRTKEGLKAARARGKTLGRPRKLNAQKVVDARRRLATHEVTIAALAEEYEVGRSTLQRALSRNPKSA